MSFENQIPARHMINPSAIGFMATIKRQPLILGNEYHHDGGCDVSSKSSLTVGGTVDDGGGPSVASPGIQTFIQVCILFLNYAELWIPGDAADVSVTSVVFARFDPDLWRRLRVGPGVRPSGRRSFDVAH